MTIRRSVLYALVLTVPFLGAHAAAGSLTQRPDARHAPRVTATETIVHSFGADPDGKWPTAKLLLSASGTLYGTTAEGGDHYCQLCGTVFELVPEAGGGYREVVLHRFRGHTEGDNPVAQLIADKNGDLFGTTVAGGAKGFGTVFEMTPLGAGFKLRTIYSFQGTPDAGWPEAAPLLGPDGTLFGTSPIGGYGSGCTPSCGSVYKLTPSKNGYTESLVFWLSVDSAIGIFPNSPLTADPAGIMFGTTPQAGGKPSKCSCGAVFSVEKTAKGYVPRALYAFRGYPDGGDPHGALLIGSAGVMYGTTNSGGESCGCGTVYAIRRSGHTYVERVLYRFEPDFDGSTPAGDLVMGPGGVLYGTTLASNGLTSCNCGTVFALTPSGGGYKESIVHAFTGPPHDGSTPLAGLVYDSATNALYGTTQNGGGVDRGTVFRIAL